MKLSSVEKTVNFFGQVVFNHLSELTSTDLKLEISRIPLEYLNCLHEK